MEYFLIAKVEQVYGKNGFVKIRSFSDFPERFLNLKKVYLDFWGDKKSFHVEEVSNVKGNYVIKFKNFDTVRDAEVLIDRDVYVEEIDSVDLPENHFYIHELIGSTVIIDKNIFGVITDVIKGKDNDVLVILTDNKQEKMIPFVLNSIERFDAVNKKLILKISKDFLEDDED